ncbi:MAG TPA: lamin tail domain-containing protein [Candidatus Paceibacterota bacterium]|nr:lamin tail domain-containing protein [Candidatus Paceibacterota bacterium]HRS47958.1 lamin tail domain-containing protein [Candidatus Paceibacterota bacterium]
MLWKTFSGFSKISFLVLAGLILVFLISALIFLNLDLDNSQVIDLSQIETTLNKPLTSGTKEIPKNLEKNTNIQNQALNSPLTNKQDTKSLFAGIKDIFSATDNEDEIAEKESLVINTQKPIISSTTLVISPTSSLSFSVDLKGDEIFSEESSNSNSDIQPFKKILISQVLFEKEDDSKFEFIELFNPNNFEVNLADWSLRKKAGESDSVLVSSKKFTGIIKPNSYFLISNPLISQEINSDLVFSGSSYSIANSNSIYLVDSSKRIVDLIGCEKAPQFESQPAPCPLKGYALSRRSVNDTDNNKNDFIISLPNSHNSLVSGFIVPLEIKQVTPSPLLIPTSIPTPDLIPTVSPTPILTPSPSLILSPTPSPTLSPTLSPTISPINFSHPQIIEVQYSSENSIDDDYVKLYNSNNFELNLDDYKLVKKIKSSGNEDSLKSWGSNDFVSANSYFYWVNSNYLAKIQELQNQGIKVFTGSKKITSTNGIGLIYNDNELVSSYNW